MQPTREQIGWWVKQAQHEMEVAESNFRAGYYDATALMCHQAAEKMLKALYMTVKQMEAPKTHVLPMLATAVGAPDEVLAVVGTLAEDYLTSRYPDTVGGVPYEQYESVDAQRRLEAVGTVARWVLGELSRQQT